MDERIPDGDLPEGLSRPARRALQGAGLTSLARIADVTEADVLRLHGSVRRRSCDFVRRSRSVGSHSALGDAGADGPSGPASDGLAYDAESPAASRLRKDPR